MNGSVAVASPSSKSCASSDQGLDGISPAISELNNAIERIAPSRANVLIFGETGTGKEVVARSIHRRSANSEGPFIGVNCSAIPADLLESELFGHKKGTFTGAISDREGRFALAANGTLFLDEIGDMPLVLQVKLLRVLEERVIYPLGSDKPVPMTARLIAATHRDLEARVSDGLFREDLFYRLKVVPITMPPLRERSEDIPLLIDSICERLERDKQAAVTFSDAAIGALREYEWPGNIRELANLLERLTVLHPCGHIDKSHLPMRMCGGSVVDFADRIDSPESSLELGGDFDLKEHLRSTEAEIIQEALAASDGVIAKAARILQVQRTTLTEKVKRLGLYQMLE